jgi:hypothetical protein
MRNDVGTTTQAEEGPRRSVARNSFEHYARSGMHAAKADPGSTPPASLLAGKNGSSAATI